MRRQTVVVLLLTLFGAVAVEVRLHRPPSWSITLGLDPAAIARWTPRLPRYAFALGYDAHLRPLLDRSSTSAPWQHAALGPSAKPMPLVSPSAPAAATEATQVKAEPFPEKSAEAVAVVPDAPIEPAPSAAADTGAASETQLPVLDFAKIAPQGTSVLAGRAEPNSRITILDGDKPIGTVDAGPDGDWSLSTEHNFADAEPKIGLLPGEHSHLADTASSTTAPPRNPAAPAEMAEAPSAPSPSEELIESLKSQIEGARSQGERADGIAEAPPPGATDTLDRTALAWPIAHDPTAAKQAKPPRDPKSAEMVSPQPTGTTQPAASAGKLPTAERQTVIPIPMQFVYREATLTEKGREALELLVEYVRLKRLEAITLSGHADERGTARYNLNLSRERLAAVKKRLRTSGYRGRIDLLAKGETEPYTGVDRTRASADELMQLDRRVELRHGR
jgi:outer membrane protein OmpA-like peptidoglycan-associated protein